MNFDVIIRRKIWKLEGDTKIKMGMLFSIPGIINNLLVNFDVTQIRYILNFSDLVFRLFLDIWMIVQLCPVGCRFQNTYLGSPCITNTCCFHLLYIHQ